MVVLVMLVMASEGSRQPGKKPSSDQQVVFCNMTEAGLTACKPSVTKPNPVDPPAKDCCQALGTADLKCLCSYKNSFVLPSLGIDPDLAIALPYKCKLPSVPQC
ncbi:Putative lipid-transfer protein DIR1 [Linum perenne]